MTNHSDIVGRGNREGAELFRNWFAELDQAAARGERAAYVFVMGSFNELLKAFDMHITFPEITSLQLAVRRVAHEYLQEAADYGYSPDIFGYVKSYVAMQLRGGEHPMGHSEALDVRLHQRANTYIKWGEIWERMHGVPIFTMDVPGHRQLGVHSEPGSPEFENDKKFVETQIRELISRCEEVTGKKFDIERLRETMG